MCGREPGGEHVAEYGVCPAAVETSIDGFNQGKNGGRACWAVSGTMCDGKVQGNFLKKMEACKKCSFFRLVVLQQGRKLQDTREIRRAILLEALKRELGEDYKEHLDLKIRALKRRRENTPKLNCWEFMDCGREPGGFFEDELGVCPAATDQTFDGLNDGKNGGRSCWAVSGTLCLGRVQEGFASKQCECERCDFYQLVILEQEGDFLNTRKIRQHYVLREMVKYLGGSPCPKSCGKAKDAPSRQVKRCANE